MKEIGRRSPARALRPALRQAVQLAQRLGSAAPVGLRLGRPALHISHHHQAMCEEPAVRRRHGHWDRKTFSVKILKKLCLPREIGIAPRAETTDRKLAVNAHAPDVVGNAACEALDANRACAPQS
jgi:hypothetical protein